MKINTTNHFSFAETADMQSGDIHVTSTLQNRCVGRNGPVQWPPRSPDLNPMYLYLWGTLRNKVYNSPVCLIFLTTDCELWNISYLDNYDI
jgi:hypothetical protein